MARSSGQLRYSIPAIRDCPEAECGFHGMVEFLVDPEVGEAYWDCPDCESAGRPKEQMEDL